MSRRGPRARAIARRVGLDLLRGLQLGLTVMFKPSDGFGQIVERCGFLHAVLPAVLYFAADAAGLYLTGFAFATQDPSQISLPLELVRVFVPWLTWCVAHYAIASVLFGEGTFRQIVVASAACLTPQLFFAVPLILLSNVLIQAEQGTYYLVLGLASGWTLLLFFLQVRYVNDFTWRRTILTTVLSLGMMLVIWVTGLVVYVLSSQLVGFGRDLWYEFLTRG